MKLITVSSKVVIFITADELNPQGRLSWKDITDALEVSYGFNTVPKTYEDFTKPGGAEFRLGRVADIELTKLTLYSNAIELVIQDGADMADKVLRDLLVWGATIGLQTIDDAPRTKWYVSELTFRTDIVLDGLHPALRRLADEVSAAVAQLFTHSGRYETTGVMLNFDDANLRLPPGAFRLERKAGGVPFSEKRYWSTAPMRTEQHIELLQNFEDALLQKGAATKKA
jgi:hypothetical protein